MSLSVGSAVLLSELVTCLKERHTATWEKIKAELCATDAEFDRAFSEVMGRRPVRVKCLHGGHFRGEKCSKCGESIL